MILRELRRRGRHATADEVRGAVRHELPGTSTPTVYAALELLVDLGLVRRIDAGAGAALYDARAEPHQHTVCRRCGRVDDLDGELDTAVLERASARAGFSAQAVEVVISGLCAGVRGRGLTLRTQRPRRSAQDAVTTRARWRSGLIRTTFQASPTLCIPAMIRPEGSTSHQRRPW